MNLFSDVPEFRAEFASQTERKSATDQELIEYTRRAKFTKAQILFQILSFFLFFGPIKVLVFVCSFLIFCFFVETLPVIRQLFANQKSFNVFCFIVLRPTVRLMLFGLNIFRVNVSDAFDKNARFIVCNNLSFLEAIILYNVSPVAMVVSAKRSKSPFLRRVALVMSLVFIDPEKVSRMEQTMSDHASDPLRLPVVVFPEFCSTNGSCVLGFNQCAFVTEYAVQPVAFRYRLWFTPRGAATVSYLYDNLFSYFWQLLSIPFISVWIEVLPALKWRGGEVPPRDRAVAAQLEIANSLGVPAVDRLGPWIPKRKGD